MMLTMNQINLRGGSKSLLASKLIHIKIIAIGCRIIEMRTSKRSFML